MTTKHLWCDFPRCACAGSCRYSHVAKQASDLQMAKENCTFPTCTCVKACAYMAFLYPDRTTPLADRTPEAIKRRWAGVDADTVNAAVGKPCPYCGEAMVDEPGARKHHPSRDHIDPKSRNGANDPSNVLIVCYACNNDKDNLTLVHWYFALEEAGDPRARHVAAFLKSWRPVREEPESEVAA